MSNYRWFLTRCEFENVGHEVITLNDQVLNNSIDLRVTVLNSGNGYISDALKCGRDDDLAKVLEQMRLESGLSVLVIAEISEQLLHSQAELLVLWVLVELVCEELDLIDNTVGVVAVTVTEKEVSTVVELVPLVGSGILHDVTLLLQDLSDISVNVLKPVLELWVLVGILCRSQYCFKNSDCEVGRGLAAT